MGDPSCCCCQLRSSGYPLLPRRDPPLQLASRLFSRSSSGWYICLPIPLRSTRWGTCRLRYPKRRRPRSTSWLRYGRRSASCCTSARGQDTITAYALEDNELWLRHLLNLLVQVAGTGYVLYKYIIADRAAIVSAAAVLVSVAGFVKYSERIWALRCASNGSNRHFRDDRSGRGFHFGAVLYGLSRNDKLKIYELIVRSAHELKYVFLKPLIIDRDEASTNWDTHISTLLVWLVNSMFDREENVLAREKRYAEEMYRAIEVQLAVAYDMLYTKAEVIHTWYGYLIRGISFLSCFAALVAFITRRSERDGDYCTPDIVITFVLLGGACALEVASAFKMIGSTWTYAILSGHGWKWLARLIVFARYHLVVVKDGRWSNSVGQYDFISFCRSPKTKLKRRMAGWIGLKDWWNKSHYTKHVKLSPALKELVWGFLRAEKNDMVQIEDVAERSGYWARRLTHFNQSQELDWSLRMEFHNCVFIWHIATHTFLREYPVTGSLLDNDTSRAKLVVNTLSDYMMYLLVQHPDILPTNAATRSLFQKTYSSYEQHWDLFSKMIIKDDIVDVPQQIDYLSKHPSRYFGSNKMESDVLKNVSWDAYPGEAVLVKASILVRTLLRLELGLPHKLVIIGRVWTEMLLHAATNASGDFHARQLSNGGEFLTHMLLLTNFISVVIRPAERIRDAGHAAADDQTVEAAAYVEPRVEVAGQVELSVHNDHHEEEITECG
uniref:Uncharacterized protein n=1 Tax=Avena sativa TaxID=4498 RepID=A0ACD5UIB8_AVESA